MREKPEYRVGVGASSMLLILVVLSLCALSLLALGSARNSAALSQRTVEMSVAYQQAAETVQRQLAALDQLLLEHAAEGLDAAGWSALLADHGLADFSLSQGDALTFALSVEAGAQRALAVEGTLSPDSFPRFTVTRHTLVNLAPFTQPAMELLLP